MKLYGLNSAHTGGQKITQVVAPKETEKVITVQNGKYIVTECFNLIKKIFEVPVYTELYITSKAWAKLMCFIHLIGEYEISGFGRIQDNIETPDGLKTAITDFDIIKQEVKSAYVESDSQAVMDFIRQVPSDQRNEWTLDWHSHVNMGVTPSGTDWTNYSSMLSARMDKQFPAMIVNKRGEVSIHQIISAGKHPDVRVKIVLEELTEEELSAIYNECKDKIEKFCTKAPAITYKNNWYSTGSNYQSSRVGYTYQDDMDDYYSRLEGYSRSKKYWWEDKMKATEEDEEVKKATEEGFVFDSVEYCPECGNPIDENDKSFGFWGICQTCLQEYDVITGASDYKNKK